MVDGLAAVELGSMLLDSTPEPVTCEPDGWAAAPAPDTQRLLLGAIRDRLEEQFDHAVRR